MNYDQVLFELRKQRNPKNVEGMARFGINPTNTLGVSIKVLREIAKRVRKEEKDGEKRHQLALRLWASSIHEGRILATIIDPPELVTENQAESWVEDLDSWDICDGFCMNLIDKTKFAYQKAMKWAKREEEYIRRAGFATMAALSVHDKDAPDTKFEKFFPLIKTYATDERNYVRKAVNWALRQIGKRNRNLLEKAILVAEEIEKIESKSAHWVAKDALRELKSRR